MEKFTDVCIGRGKRGHIVADTLLPTQMFPRLPARATFVADTFCVRDTKMCLILFRNILCQQLMFPSLRSPRNIMGNNVSATMCPRLPGPLIGVLKDVRAHCYCTSLLRTLYCARATSCISSACTESKLNNIYIELMTFAAP